MTLYWSKRNFYFSSRTKILVLLIFLITLSYKGKSYLKKRVLLIVFLIKHCDVKTLLLLRARHLTALVSVAAGVVKDMGGEKGNLQI